MRFMTLLPLAAMLVPAANAQTAPQPQGQPLGGLAVPGVCMLSREAIYTNAAIGKAAVARLKQLSDVAQGEVDAQRKPIEADIKTFQTDAPKLTPEQRAQRQQALGARLQPVQALAEQRSREIDATRVKALQRIAEQVQPLIAPIYTAHKCGLLMDRGTLLGGNFTNDLTPEVVKAIDAKVTTITFEREVLPAQAK